MIPWFAEWVGVHCDRFGMDPDQCEVNLHDIRDFFEKNAVAEMEAYAASREMADKPPKFFSAHLETIKAKVYSVRARKYVKPEDTKPTSEDLDEAKRVWRHFMETRNKRTNERVTA